MSSRSFVLYRDDLFQDVADDERKGLTVVSLIVDLHAILSIAGTGGIVAMGITLVGDEALASLALPDADQVDDQPGWLWRAAHTVHSSANSDFAQAVPFGGQFKSKRRLRGEDETLLLIMDNISLTNNVNITGMVRVGVLKS